MGKETKPHRPCPGKLCRDTNRQKHVVPNTKDHIFPRVAGKRDRELFSKKEVIDAHDNQIAVCASDHRDIDRIKIGAYRVGGPLDLIDQVAAYPRYQKPDDLEAQRSQWIRLFTSVIEQIIYSRTNGFILSDSQLQVEEQCHWYVRQWIESSFHPRLLYPRNSVCIIIPASFDR